MERGNHSILETIGIESGSHRKLETIGVWKPIELGYHWKQTGKYGDPRDKN